MGFEVWGWGFGVGGLGFGVWGLGFGVCCPLPAAAPHVVPHLLVAEAKEIEFCKRWKTLVFGVLRFMVCVLAFKVCGFDVCGWWLLAWGLRFVV